MRNFPLRPTSASLSCFFLFLEDDSTSFHFRSLRSSPQSVWIWRLSVSFTLRFVIRQQGKQFFHHFLFDLCPVDFSGFMRPTWESWKFMALRFLRVSVLLKHAATFILKFRLDLGAFKRSKAFTTYNLHLTNNIVKHHQWNYYLIKNSFCFST